MVNSAPMNTGVKISFHIIVFLTLCPGMGCRIVWQLYFYWFIFLRSLHTVPTLAVQTGVPTTVWAALLFSAPSSAFVTGRLFGDSHSGGVWWHLVQFPKLIFFWYSWFTVLCYFLVCNKVSQCDTCIYVCIFWFFSIIGYYKILSISLCSTGGPSWLLLL